MKQGLEQAINAAARWRDRADMRFVFVGAYARIEKLAMLKVGLFTLLTLLAAVVAIRLQGGSSPFLSRFGCSEIPCSLASELEAFSGRQSSRHVAACALARAAVQSLQFPTGQPVYSRACFEKVSPRRSLL